VAVNKVFADKVATGGMVPRDKHGRVEANQGVQCLLSLIGILCRGGSQVPLGDGWVLRKKRKKWPSLHQGAVTDRESKKGGSLPEVAKMVEQRTPPASKVLAIEGGLMTEPWKNVAAGNLQVNQRPD